MDPAPERERRALCCSAEPLGGGVWNGLGFDAPCFLGEETWTNLRQQPHRPRAVGG